MVFSSHIFLFYFLPLALAFYYLSPRPVKSLSLTLVSYVFYGWWNPWFACLMLGSTVVDYLCGKAITADNAPTQQRKLAITVSVVVNLLILGFFKYAAFFAVNLGFGSETPFFLTHVVLPIGISFYTFQSMSYSIDLYRGHAKPARNLIEFACYVAMFPQLVAGPIVRWGSVATQLQHRCHTAEAFLAGLTRFNYGFAKKILIANNVAPIADACFAAGEGSLSTPMAWIGVIAYAFQIYFDFSAYTDMALGLGRMFGFELPENFNSPYRSKSITDFWRRWHISLSSFLRDYVYIPMGGNRKGINRTYINIALVMLIGGLWHGAQWTFIIWGGLHGLMLITERILSNKKILSVSFLPIQMPVTFILVLFTWVFFRAESLPDALRYISVMLGLSTTDASASLLTRSVLEPFYVYSLILAAVFVWTTPKIADFLSLISLRKCILSFILLIIAVRQLFYQEFNPFLYFQF